jgi:hypothetical protein
MQMNSLNDNEKRLLDFTGIIIIHPNQWPITVEDYNGIILSDIVISEKLVPSYMDRYLITHYLMNQMHSRVTIYDPVQKTYVPIVEPYIFPNYDLYISRKAESICNVIYHFVSKEYYSVYKNFPDECYSLVNDKRLGNHMDLLIDSLKKEGLNFPLHYRM